MIQRLLMGLLMLAPVVCAQQRRVDPRNTYHRAICVVPMIGSGTPDDPKRPQYAPNPNTSMSDGIIGFTQVPSDDGKFAIVEFVARTRKALAAVLADTTIIKFEKGAESGDAIEAALKKWKQDFSLVKFEVVMP